MPCALSSGLRVFSRLPILNHNTYSYKNAMGCDSLACKGAVHIEVEIPSADTRCGTSNASAGSETTKPMDPPRRMHLFATHTQAWDSPREVATRMRQFGELRSFIASLELPRNEPVAVLGDLNSVSASGGGGT